LSVNQEKRYQKVASPREFSLDLPFIAATNRNLETAVEKGEFRQDLFYRLNVIRIDLPPLRERPGDIPLLLDHFLQIYNREYGRSLQGFSPEALEALICYDYPGNVRELENLVERCVVLAGNHTEIPFANLPPALRQRDHSPSRPARLPEEGLNIEKVVADLEIALICQALERCDNNKTQAAALLGLSFRSFRYRLQKYGLQ
jgi:two-component system response regulator PilR (NtrC family)